jgi:nucleoside 2-deoxyribosyltransferase
MKIYLGGPMFTAADIHYNLALTTRLRSLGFGVYCPNENSSINDKTRSDLTGEAIYRADIAELKSSNVFLCQVAEDSGTMWEAGYMDCLAQNVDPNRYLGSIGLATDIRLQTQPDATKSGPDNQAFYINQFVAGGLKLSLGIYLTEERLIDRLISLSEGAR